MKLLLDECVVQDFRHLISGHDVFTVAYMGWSGVKNGQLLIRAAAEGFDALVTTDRGFQHQQNPATLPVAVIVLMAATNDLDALKVLVPQLMDALTRLAPRTVTTVEAAP
jgi:hypothetical protein